MARGAWVALGAFVGLLAIAAPAGAQDFSLVTTLVHPNTRPNNEDRFGSGLAISGGTLFVGAKDEKAANDYSGVVHVFSDAGWSEVAQLKSSVDADYEFGASIQLDGDQALISNADIDYGLVWFFEKDQGVWTEKLRIKGLVNEAFGYRLALRGDFAFVAASRVGTGSVHVYRRVSGTWSESQVLTASDAQDQDFFGYAIAFDGQRLAVSAPGNMLGPKRCGVYTFSKVGDLFVEDGKLAGDPATHWYGADVGVSGDTLIVNAPPAYQVTSVGKALVYTRQGDQWVLESELTVDGEASFPGGLALDGETAWFGARTSDPSAQSVYAFQRSNGAWHQGQKLNFPTPGQYEIASWAVRDGTLAVGFWNGVSTNSVQVYRGPGHESPSGGGSTAAGGSAGAAPNAGSTNAGTNAGGTSGNGDTAAGGSSNASTNGGGPTENAGAESSSGGATAGQETHAENAKRGGCTLAPSSRGRAWPLAALAFVGVLAWRRRAKARSFRGRGVRPRLAITVITGSMLSACSGQSISAPSQTSGTNAGGAAGATVTMGGTASSSGGNASVSGGNASGSGGLPISGGDASGGAGRSSVGGSSFGGAGTGGTPTAMAGAAGSVGHEPGCPASFAEAFPFPVSGPTPLCTEQGRTCELLIACSSGPKLLNVTCKNHRWEVDALSCSNPYDFCPGVPGQNGSNVPGVYCTDRKWSVVDTRAQTLQPKPCPAQPPAEASICDQGSSDYFIYDHCGYPCPSDRTKWTVFACANPPNYLGHVAWFSDGACD